MRRVLCFLLLLCLPAFAQARTFPWTSDPSLAAQERWGSFSRGYVTDGCWHGTAAGTTAQIASCRAFALETADPESLQGFEELTPRDITYSAGDGTYWLGGRSNPALTPAGWTCLPGLHYCTLKADTPPQAANGLVLLGKTTLSAGAISAFSIQAMWRRTTPYTVPGGTTLTFGVCPEAEAVHLFQAMNDGSSGAVRWTPEACHHVLPEWWGADPTGVVDATLIWRQVLASARPTVTPVWCQGNYLLSATEPAQALTLIGGEQIVGPSVLSSTPIATNVRPCQLTFAGTGRAIGTTATQENKPHMYLAGLFLVDRDNTASMGLDMTGIRGSTIRDVQIHGFATGLWVGQNFYYGEIRGVRAYKSRTFCADFSGSGLNGALIDLGCNSDSLTMTAGIRMGSAPGLFGTGHNARLRFVIETSSGVALSLARQRGMEMTVYVELKGNKADHSASGAVLLSNLQGVLLHGKFSSSTEDGPPPIGIRVLASPGSDQAYRNVKISGEVFNFATPIRIDGGEGSYGVDISQLSVDQTMPLVLGDYTTGLMLGQNLVTHGGDPTIDTGRGSTAAGTVWKAGDVLWKTSGSPSMLTNVLSIVTTAGNPPAVSTFILPSVTPTVVTSAETTPSVKVGQIFNTRFAVDAGSPITDFIDEIANMCIWIRATGARTITDGAAIDLPTGNFNMTANDTLTLCIVGGVWREYARTDYP